MAEIARNWRDLATEAEQLYLICGVIAFQSPGHNSLPATGG